MASFEDAIGTILGHEGGFVDNPSDPGGATNFGITKKTYEAFSSKSVSVDDIRNMSKDAACNVYKTWYWDKGLFGSIDNQNIATKYFDMTVNMGPHAATCILQAALQAIGQQITIDGSPGPKTLVLINAVDPQQLLFHIRDQQAQHYKDLVARNSNLSVFLKGWLNRAYS